jgi:hypothetical protein
MAEALPVMRLTASKRLLLSATIWPRKGAPTAKAFRESVKTELKRK